MKDYERYMNRQKLSETRMVKLVRLETERPEKRAKHVPQWVKYCGMAASLVVVFGVFAFAILQGGVGIDPNSIANASATPAAEELYFNEVVSVPFTGEAIAGGMKLEPMEIADIALLFGSSEDDFDGFKADMGWGEFNMEYYSVDMGSNGWRFLLKGDYVLPSSQPEETSFTAVDTVWLEIYEGHSYLSEEAWQVAVVPYNDTQYCKFIPCQINGHRVVAACDENHGRAAAAFDVACNGKTYGVVYAVTAYGEEDARELVTKLVQRITKDGLYPEMYGVQDDLTLRYAELTEPSVGGMTVLAGETNRPLTREELEAVYPVAAGEDGENYIWYGTAYYKADGNLRAVSIQGDRMDETASVNIVVAAAAEDAFIETDGKSGKSAYYGPENAIAGLSLLQCFYVHGPGYFNSAANAYHCYAQYQTTGSSKYAQVRTCVENGSLLEGETFNEKWFYRTYHNGLWFSGGKVNGKEYWDLPETKKAVELLGSYQYVEMTDEDMVFCPVMMFYADGGFRCVSDLASSHICVGSFTVKDGRVTANCERHRYVFDVIDENNLRFVAADSDSMPRYIGPKVTDGAVFRRELDDEGNIVTPDGVPVIYDQSGSKVSYDNIKGFVYKMGEEVSWKDLPVGDGEHIIAWNQADTAGERMKEGGSVWVWGETTHHPESSDHVEVTHHADEHHSSSHH